MLSEETLQVAERRREAPQGDDRSQADVHRAERRRHSLGAQAVLCHHQGAPGSLQAAPRAPAVCVIVAQAADESQDAVVLRAELREPSPHLHKGEKRRRLCARPRGAALS